MDVKARAVRARFRQTGTRCDKQVRRLAPGARFVLVPEASHLTLILHPQAMSMVGAWFAEALQGAGGGE